MAYLPVESIIRDQQETYYGALKAADKLAEASPFVEFMLGSLRLALIEAEAAVVPNSSEESSEESSLLRLLKTNPQLAGKQAAEQLGLSQRAVEKLLAKLKAAGRIERVGPNKGGYWRVFG